MKKFVRFVLHSFKSQVQFLLFVCFFFFFFKIKSKLPCNRQFCVFFSNILHQNNGNCFNIICYNETLYHSENRKTSSNQYVCKNHSKRETEPLYSKCLQSNLSRFILITTLTMISGSVKLIKNYKPEIKSFVSLNIKPTYL